MKNTETVNYLNIMIDGLVKKEECLNSLLEKTMAQSELVSGKEYDNVNWAQFEIYMVEKDADIEKINEIDDGFDKVFSRVQPELDANKDEYKDQIKKLQELITRLTNIGAKISVTEERNRQEIDKIMTSAKASIGKARRNLKATNGYISSLYSQANSSNSTLIDSKK